MTTTAPPASPPPPPAPDVSRSAADASYGATSAEAAPSGGTAMRRERSSDDGERGDVAPRRDGRERDGQLVDARRVAGVDGGDQIGPVGIHHRDDVALAGQACDDRDARRDTHLEAGVAAGRPEGLRRPAVHATVEHDDGGRRRFLLLLPHHERVAVRRRTPVDATHRVARRVVARDEVVGALPELMESKLGLVGRAASRNRVDTAAATLRDLASEIEWSKVSNVRPEDYERVAEARGREISVPAATVARVFSSYEDLKREAGRMDMEDVLLCAAAVISTPSTAMCCTSGPTFGNTTGMTRLLRANSAPKRKVPARP